MPTLQELQELQSGGAIAGAYGYNPSDYGDYFTALSQDILKASEEDYWKKPGGYFETLAGGIGREYQTGAGALTESARGSLYGLGEQRRTSHGGFAGSGAGEKAYGRGRESLFDKYMSGMSGLRESKAKGMYGLEQDITDRMASAQSSIADWYQSQIGSALRLKEIGAPKEEPPVSPPGPTSLEEAIPGKTQISGTFSLSDEWNKVFNQGLGRTQGGYGTGSWFKADGTYGMNGSLSDAQIATLTNEESAAYNNWLSSRNVPSENVSPNPTYPVVFNP